MNEEYLSWLKSDQLLLGWLFSTINKEDHAQVVVCS